MKTLKGLTPRSAVMYVLGALVTAFALVFALWLPSLALGSAEGRTDPNSSYVPQDVSAPPDASPAEQSRIFIRHGLLLDFIESADQGSGYSAELGEELQSHVLRQILTLSEACLGTLAVYSDVIRFDDAICYSIGGEEESFELYDISGSFYGDMGQVSFAVTVDPEDYCLLALEAYIVYENLIYDEYSAPYPPQVNEDFSAAIEKYRSAAEVDMAQLAAVWGEQLGLDVVLCYAEGEVQYYEYSTPDTGDTVTFSFLVESTAMDLIVSIRPE